MSTQSATYACEGYKARRNPIAKTFSTIFGLFADLGRASEAAAIYERLSHLSDESLARRGLTRGELPSYAYNLIFPR